MYILAAFLTGIFFLSRFLGVEELPGEKTDIRIDGGARVSVMPLSEIKSRHVIKQQFDLSCGAAALATVLNYHLGKDLTEMDAIDGMFKHGDMRKIIERRGFSLLDMKRFVESIGFSAVGYKAGIEDLKNLDMPCIVPIVVREDLHHFVVFRDIYRGHVFLADPARGNVNFTVPKFKEVWHQNVAFVVYPEEGGVELDALKLTEEDLRILDLDMVRRTLFHYTPPFIIPFERQIQEVTGIPLLP